MVFSQKTCSPNEPRALAPMMGNPGSSPVRNPAKGKCLRKKDVRGARGFDSRLAKPATSGAEHRAIQHDGFQCQSGRCVALRPNSAQIHSRQTFRLWSPEIIALRKRPSATAQFFRASRRSASVPLPGTRRQNAAPKCGPFPLPTQRKFSTRTNCSGRLNSRRRVPERRGVYDNVGIFFRVDGITDGQAGPQFRPFPARQFPATEKSLSLRTSIRVRRSRGSIVCKCGKNLRTGGRRQVPMPTACRHLLLLPLVTRPALAAEHRRASAQDRWRPAVPGCESSCARYGTRKQRQL